MPTKAPRQTPPPEPIEQLLDEGAAARLLGLQRHTLATQRCLGRLKLPYVRLGGRAIRYRPSDLAAYVNANLIVPNAD